MNTGKKIVRWLLGGVLLLIAILGIAEFFTVGYNPQNEGILLFSDPFRVFFNAMMDTYLGIGIRFFHVLIGILLFTKRYWFIGLLIHLPIAFNIFFIHLFHDIPFADPFFFGMGMFVSLATFVLLFMERKRFNSWVIQPDVKPADS
ncbi:MAG: hypothetical protein AAF632_08595 [Bacteroidota bacterium]